MQTLLAPLTPSTRRYQDHKRIKTSAWFAWMGLVSVLMLVAASGQSCVDLPAPIMESDLAPATDAADDVPADAGEQAGPDAAPPPDAPAAIPAETGAGQADPGGSENDPTGALHSDESASPIPAPIPEPTTEEPGGGREPAPSPEPLPDTTPKVDVPQTQLKPIARWNVVPYQRINAGSTLKIGVVAFSKYGISHVRFTVIGQGYTGPNPVDVSEMTLNDQTGTYEYWMPINGSDFTSDGPVTIEAEVYGWDGGYRNKDSDGGGVGLDALPLVVNPTGSLPQVQAWVSPQGNDGSGAVEDPSRPFASIGRAIDAIRKHRAALGLGDNADGGIVRLTPGNHSCSSGGVGGSIACDNEWLTITTAAGGTHENTVLLPGGIVPTRKIALRGLTLKGAGTLAMSYNDRTQCMVWADGCSLIGSGRGITTSHPLSSEYAALYYTESSITQVHQATSGSVLCRNLTIHTISDDAFQNVPLVINCVVDDIDPLGTGAHADLWQHAGGNPYNKKDDNVIVYNLVATGLKYQSIFIRADINSPPSMAQGMAFVNVYTEMLPDSHGWGGWGRMVDHLLWWHCTFAGKGMGFMKESYQGGAKTPCRITNMSVKGCDFAFFGDGGAEIDWTEWDSNHFVGGDVQVGTNLTTGDRKVDGSGIPAADSPLVDRFDAIVPVDANNRPRGAKADVGAFER